jgi:hypothetical protein
MHPLYILVAFLSLILFWFVLTAVATFLFSVFCLLFGHNLQPAAIPNKAVWG